MQNGQSVKFSYAVNPAILGGLIVDFGERSIDLSVSSRVNKLNAAIARAYGILWSDHPALISLCAQRPYEATVDVRGSCL